MRQTILLLLFTIFLNSCAHGPKVNVGVSDPSLGQFKESNWKGKTIAPVPYSNTNGWSVYPPDSEQRLFNYCGARSDQSTQAPSFDACKSNVRNGTFDCESYVCQIIPAGNGISCHSVSGYSVAWADSANYVGFNPADNQTLVNYCNVLLN